MKSKNLIVFDCLSFYRYLRLLRLCGDISVESPYIGDSLLWLPIDDVGLLPTEEKKQNKTVILLNKNVYLPINGDDGDVGYDGPLYGGCGGGDTEEWDVFGVVLPFLNGENTVNKNNWVVNWVVVSKKIKKDVQTNFPKKKKR